MSHTRRASNQIRVGPAGDVSADPVDELLVDPNLGPDAPLRLEQLKQPGTSKDAIVAKEVGGPAATARDVVAERLEQPLNAAQLQALKQPIPGGTVSPILVERAIAQMSADGFSEPAQRRFIEKVREQVKLKPLKDMSTSDKRFVMSSGQRQDMAYIAELLRAVSQEPSTPVGNREPGQVKYDLEPLSQFFGEYGQRLRWFDKLDPEQHFSSLDRGSFRDRLHAVLERVEASGGVITKPQLDSLLGMLVEVKDVSDMKFARWMINRRVISGQLTIPDNLRIAFDHFMAEKLVDQVDVRQIGLEAYLLRQRLQQATANLLPGGLDRDSLKQLVAEARDRLTATIDAATADKDPDALHYARRVVCRQLGDKCGLAEGFDLRDQLLKRIDARIGDRLDRYSIRRNIEARRAKGELTDAQAAVARLAIAESNTNSELRAVLPRVDAFLPDDLKISEAMLAAMAETASTISRNMSSDELDANGNVIRSEAQRAREQDARLAQERLFELRISEDRQRLRTQSESVALGDDRLRRAQSSQIVVKPTRTRIEAQRHTDIRIDLRRATFHIARTHKLVKQVVVDARAVRRVGGQSMQTAGASLLGTASTREQVGRALGVMNQAAGEISKNSPTSH